MADTFETLMKTLADEQNAKVDYSAMHEAILQKAAGEKRKRAQFVRYGAMAASLVVLLGAGAVYLGANGAFDGINLNQMKSSEMMPQSSVSGEQNPDGMLTCEPPGSMADVPPQAAMPQPYATDEAYMAPPPAACGPSGSAAQDSNAVTAFSTQELVDICLAARGETANRDAGQSALASFEWLYAPEATAEGYRLVDIVADASGITYTYNRAAAEVYNDAYAVFISAESLFGAKTEAAKPAAGQITADANGVLTWLLGNGAATLTPAEGCTLSAEALKTLCALKPVPIE